MNINVDDIMKIAGLVTLIVGVWWRLQHQITTNDAKQASDLSAFKLYVAEKYASHDAMKEALGPLVKELHGLRDRLDRFIDKRTE